MRKLHYLLIISLLITLLSFVLVSIPSGNIFKSNENQNTEAKASQTNTNYTTPAKPYNKNEATENKLVYITDDKSKAKTSTDGQPAINLPSEEQVKANVIYSLPIKERAVFITIDDGWTPCWPLITLMQKDHLPITSFLIAQAAQKHKDYWQAFLAAGGTIENHTFSHQDLTSLSLKDISDEIIQPIDYYESIGVHTSLLRPPFGAYNDAVRQVSHDLSIKHIVLWSATMNKGILTTINKKPLQPGAIILMHWVPDLYNQLTKLLTILKDENLGVADLTTAIKDPDNIKVIWLNQ